MPRYLDDHPYTELGDRSVPDSSVRTLINQHSVIRKVIDYNAFGNVVPGSEINFDDSAHGYTGAVDQLFRFTGRYTDEDTGLQNNLHRWYDPKIGRWLSQDPIGFAGGDANLYRYVGNGPANATDPSGLAPEGTGGLPAVIAQGMLHMHGDVHGGYAEARRRLAEDAAKTRYSFNAFMDTAMIPLTYGAEACSHVALGAAELVSFGAIPAIAGRRLIRPPVPVVASVKVLTAIDEIQSLGSLAGKSNAEIAALLKAAGYTPVTAKNGGTIWTRPIPDGNTVAVRVDPAMVRPKPKGYADEVPHVHKEIVPTSKVVSGNFKASDATTFDDCGLPSLDARKTHIPGGH